MFHISHRAPSVIAAFYWWGTLSGIVIIETTAFALAIGAYFYLRTRVTHWPPQRSSTQSHLGELPIRSF